MGSMNVNDKRRKRDDVESFIGKHLFLLRTYTNRVAGKTLSEHAMLCEAVIDKHNGFLSIYSKLGSFKFQPA